MQTEVSPKRVSAGIANRRACALLEAVEAMRTAVGRYNECEGMHADFTVTIQQKPRAGEWVQPQLLDQWLECAGRGD